MTTTPASPIGIVDRWSRATFLGWFLGFGLILVCIAVSGTVGLGSTQFPVGLGMGLGVGLVQRRVIAEYFGTGAGWLGATTAGITAPFLAHDVSKVFTPSIPYGLAGAVAVGGLCVGLLQWRVLRRHLAGGFGWVPASVLGWALAASTAVLNDKVFPKIPGIIGALTYIGVILIGGVLVGGVTGLMLKRLMSQRAAT